jgi:hypothetical protein
MAQKNGNGRILISGTQVHPETFAEALVLSLACEDQAVISVARAQLTLTFTVLEQFAPSRSAFSALPLLGVITHLACISCYRREWLAKAAGCTTIAALLQTMHPEWLRAHLIQLSKVRVAVVFRDSHSFFCLWSIFGVWRLCCAFPILKSAAHSSGAVLRDDGSDKRDWRVCRRDCPRPLS